MKMITFTLHLQQKLNSQQMKTDQFHAFAALSTYITNAHHL